MEKFFTFPLLKISNVAMTVSDLVVAPGFVVALLDLIVAVPDHVVAVPSLTVAAPEDLLRPGNYDIFGMFHAQPDWMVS